MPCNNALSWSSFPLRATDLAITRTSLTVSNPIYPRVFFAVAAQSDATAAKGKSASDLFRDQTACALLLDRPSPLLPTSGIHEHREDGRIAWFRPHSPPPYAYELPAFLDRARCHHSFRSLHADPGWRSSCTFCAGNQTTPT